MHPVEAFLPVSCQAVYVYALGDDVADDHARVQGGLGVLEDHLHLPVESLALIARRLVDVLAPVEHLAARRIVEPDKDPSRRRLAAARLADQAERFTLIDLERDPIDRLQVLPTDPEVLLEVFDLQQWPAVAVLGHILCLIRHPVPLTLAGGSTLGAIWWCNQHAALCSSENAVYSGISSAQICMA